MKAEQSSLYRHLETLHLWCLDTFENIPNNATLREDLRLLIENVVQAQSAVAMALLSENIKQKFDLLDVVVMNMTNVKTITKVLTEYSSGENRGSHVISKKSRIRLLDIMAQIGEELGRWRNSVLSKIKQIDAANLSK